MNYWTKIWTNTHRYILKNFIGPNFRPMHVFNFTNCTVRPCTLTRRDQTTNTPYVLKEKKLFCPTLVYFNSHLTFMPNSTALEALLRHTAERLDALERANAQLPYTILTVLLWCFVVVYACSQSQCCHMERFGHRRNHW